MIAPKMNLNFSLNQGESKYCKILLKAAAKKVTLKSNHKNLLAQLGNSYSGLIKVANNVL